MLVALTPATRIFVAVAPVDLRRGFDGLSAHVETVLQQHGEVEQLRARNRALQAEKVQWQAQADALRQETLRLQSELALKEGLETQLRQALVELAELKRQLFGERSDKLTPEEEGQLAEIAGDLREQAQRDSPVSGQVLEDEAQQPAAGKDAPKSQRARRRGHPLPEHLERQTVVLAPKSLQSCEQCDRPLERIGEEVSEELEYVPAQLVVRRTVRPQYACRCGCGGVQVAPLPARLLPQSKLGWRWRSICSCHASTTTSPTIR